MWRSLVVVICGCNQIYDLSPTGGPDSDRDGVLDGTDNCTLVANRDQRDGDGDGIGDTCDPCVAGPQLAIDDDRDGVDDACDSCLTGANNDEDGDGLGDGCDSCPADAGEQTDGDGDGVGDACDHAPGVPNERVLFDGFAPPRTEWSTGFQPWAASDGRFGPVPPIEGVYIGAWYPGSLLPATGWRIAAEIMIPPSPQPSPFSLKVTVSAVTEFGGQSGRGCELSYAQGGWRLFHNDGTFTPLVLGERTRLEVREPASFATECWIDGTLRATTTHNGPAAPYRALFEGSVPMEMTWIDIVR